MRKSLYKMIALLLSVAGTLLAIYVGGYLLLIKPVRYLYIGVLHQSLTTRSLAVCIIQIVFASTAAGGIWSICDIIAGIFRDAAESREM